MQCIVRGYDARLGVTCRIRILKRAMRTLTKRRAQVACDPIENTMHFGLCARDKAEAVVNGVEIGSQPASYGIRRMHGGPASQPP